MINALHNFQRDLYDSHILPRVVYFQKWDKGDKDF